MKAVTLAPTVEPVGAGTTPQWRTWQCVAIGFSLANLASFQRWKPMLAYSARDTYFMRLPPAPAEYWAAIVCVLLLGGVFSLITLFVSRIEAGRMGRVARCLWLLLLLKPVLVFASPIRNLLVQTIGEYRLPLLSVAAVLLIAAFGLWPMKIFPWAMHGLLIFSPFVAVTLAQACWHALRYDPDAFLDQPAASALPFSPPGQPRIVWLIFDEMDQRLIFEDRAADLQLPEMDRLRGVSVYASRAYPPAGSTLSSMPSLILGKRLLASRPGGPGDLRVRDNGNAAEATWTGQPNVFSRTRALGLNTALVGWYHPYCRVLASDLTRCHWLEAEEWVNVTGRTFGQSLLNQLGMIVYLPHAQSLAMEARVRRRTELTSAALAAAQDGSMGLTFLHFHGSHVPYVYDRLERQFITSDPDGHGYNPRHYLDGVALADRSLGRLRRALEEVHAWDTTTVIVSSDHWYRESKAFDGKTDERVPFLVKMAGQTAPLVCDTPFNTVLTQGLVLAILRKEVVSANDVLAWVNVHRNDVPLQPL